MHIAAGSTMRSLLLAGKARIGEVVPVMLAPFSADGSVDLEGLDSLIDWYISHGASGLFAVCQSSEMEFLTLAEKYLHFASRRRSGDRTAPGYRFGSHGRGASSSAR